VEEIVSMAQWVRVASLAEIPPGSAKEVQAADRIVALYKVEGTVHAMDGICPHQGGPLGQGLLDGRVVTCPWHGWQFDVTTGQHRVSCQIQQERIPVRVDGDDVFVSI